MDRLNTDKNFDITKVPGIKTPPDHARHFQSFDGKSRSLLVESTGGPTWYTDGWTLQENMVLALHPASLVEGDRAFFICENYRVRPGGAEPLSPLESFYSRLPAS